MVVYIDPTPFNRICPRCQANVHGLDIDRCPECGGSMVPSCISCGYDLAGLPRDGVCPECGTPIERSYAPDLLENRSIEFLMQLRSGLSLVVWSILTQVALKLLAFTGGIAAMTMGFAPPSSQPIFELFTRAVGLVLTILVLWGWWRITTPDPSRAGTDLDVKPRKVIRVAVVLQAAVGLAGLAFAAAYVGTQAISNTLAIIALGVGLAYGLAWIVQFFAVMLYLQWLARRIPDPKLHGEARQFMWLGPLLYVVGAFCLGLGPVVAMILYLMMLFTLRKHLTNILISRGAI